MANTTFTDGTTNIVSAWLNDINATTYGVGSTTGYLWASTGNGSLGHWIAPYSYTLPTASTTVLGGVKVDGTSITISGGIISSTSSSGNITSLGTVTTGTWNATVVAGQYGGTGVANTGKTFTMGGNVTFSGAYAMQFTVPGAYTYTLPSATSTLAQLGANTFTGNQALGNHNLSGIKTATYNGTIALSATTGAAAVDWTTGQICATTLTGDITAITQTNPAGPCHVTFILDPTASAYSIVWPTSNWYWTSPGEPTVVASKKVIVSGVFDGTNYWMAGGVQN